MHGLVRCKHVRRCSCACGEDASFTDVKIKPQIANRTRGCEWCHAAEAWAEDFGDLRKSSELSSCVRTERLIFGARRGQTSSLQMGCRMWFGGDVKAVSIERLWLSLSSCRKTFNSKVIKFRTWTIFMNVMYFGFPYVYFTHPYIWRCHICILANSR